MRALVGVVLITSVLFTVQTASAAPSCPGQGRGEIGDTGLSVVVECPAPKPPSADPVVPVTEPPRPDPCTTLVDRGNGNVVLVGNCLNDGLLRPVPPAPGSVFAQVPIPPTQINTSPSDQTVVGVRTDLWYTDPGPVVAQVSLTDPNGFVWVGEARASVVRYTWHMGIDHDRDGVEDFRTASQPGSAESPSAHYVYQHDCQCTLTVVATWSGTYTLTEATTGTTYTNVSLGEHGFAATAPYSAVEVEAVITR